MLIQKVDEVVKDHGIKCVLYGASGVGKTTQIKTLVSEGFKVLVISAESGLLSLAGTKVDMVDISTNDKGEQLPPSKRFERLLEVYKYMSSQKHGYDTIVLDSLTELNSCLLEALREKFPDAKDTLRMFGENSMIMQKMIKAFRDLEINVILIALESNEKDDVGRRFTTIDVVGKVAAAIPPLFDEVLYMFVDDKGGRQILTNKSEKTVAKDRSGKLTMVEEANLGKIFKKIKGGQ
jgi:phage nucleotide-binding protein